MDQYLPLINTILGASVLVLQIALVLVIVIALFSSKKLNNSVIALLNRHAISLTFIVTLVGMLLSLFYSNIVGYAPCELCWILRIFLYSQVFILGLALWKKDQSIVDYSILLSAIGLLFSIYQKYVEISGHASIICGAGQVSCAKIYVLEFGYITIPVMAMTAFAVMLTLMIIRKASTK